MTGTTFACFGTTVSVRAEGPEARVLPALARARRSPSRCTAASRASTQRASSRG